MISQAELRWMWQLVGSGSRTASRAFATGGHFSNVTCNLHSKASKWRQCNVGLREGGEQHHHHGDSLHAWHCGWLYSGCLAAQSMILVAPSTILLIPFQFSLIYLSTIKVQHNHKYFIWTICLKSINNVLDLHIKMCQLFICLWLDDEKLSHCWVFTFLNNRIPFGIPRSSRGINCGISNRIYFHQSWYFFSAFLKRKDFPPLQRYFTTALDKQGCWLSIGAIFAKCKCRQSVPQIFAPDTWAVSLGACVRSKMSHQREF